MNLLLVEDRLKFARTFTDEIGHLDPSIVITLARSRDDAIGALSSQPFDCVVCDLKIPAAGKSLSPAEDHGRDVIAYVQEHHTGTPIIVLSAFADLQKCRDLQARGGNQDLFGNGSDYAMLYPLNKTELTAALTRVRDMASELRIVDAIRLSFAGANIQLEDWERRVIKTYARTRGAYEVRISRVGGGLSGSRTYSMKTVGTDLDINGSVLAKLGPISELADEKKRYENHVLPRLREGHYAPLTSSVWAGAGAKAGLFYRLADGYDETLADAITSDPARAALIVKRLAEIERPWVEGAPARQLTVAEIRHSLISDDLADKLLGADIADRAAFEKTSLAVRQACQHGDLHPLNVLVHGDSGLLVDFGNVGPAVASLDPIQLELALVFHPAMIPKGNGWPTLTHVQSWANLDEYILDCPFGDVIRECRAWAFQAGQSDFAVFANAYSYAIKQLKFGTTSRELPLAIARSAMSQFR